MAKPPKPQQIRTIDDERGNLLLTKSNGKRILLSLKLAAERRYRNLGFINIATKALHVRRDTGKHLMRAINGYGFNYKLLADAKKFDKIRLKDTNSEWVIPREFILSKGAFLHFLGQGFEKQIFIALDAIQEFKKENKI